MYRERKRRCPGCSSAMRQIPLALPEHGDGGDDDQGGGGRDGSEDAHGGAREVAEIDLCGACGGVYLEFFDGEPATLAGAIVSSRDVDELAALARRDDVAPKRWPPVCPDCGAGMVEQPYLGNGPAIPRCQVCMGVFATPSAVRALAGFDPNRAPSGRADGVIAALRALLTRIVG